MNITAQYGALQKQNTTLYWKSFFCILEKTQIVTKCGSCKHYRVVTLWNQGSASPACERKLTACTRTVEKRLFTGKSWAEHLMKDLLPCLKRLNVSFWAYTELQSRKSASQGKVVLPCCLWLLGLVNWKDVCKHSLLVHRHTELDWWLVPTFRASLTLFIFFTLSTVFVPIGQKERNKEEEKKKEKHKPNAKIINKDTNK